MIRNLIKSSTPINNINLIKMIKTNQLNKKNLKQKPNSTIRENDICAYGKQLISQNNKYRSKQHNQINQKQQHHNPSEKNNGWELSVYKQGRYIERAHRDIIRRDPERYERKRRRYVNAS